MITNNSHSPASSLLSKTSSHLPSKYGQGSEASFWQRGVSKAHLSERLGFPSEIEKINTSFYPNVNFQASRDIFDIKTTRGRTELRELTKAYQRGEPVSTPGAEKALETTLGLVRRLIGENINKFSEEELAGMRRLEAWVKNVKEAGCLHDATEQVCLCVAHVYEWVNNIDSRKSHPESSNNLTLTQVFELPWDKFQTEREFFDKAYVGLYGYRGYYFSGKKATSLRWPRLCTYESLDIELILATMGLMAGVENFLTVPNAYHDGLTMDMVKMPTHDRVHLDSIAKYLIHALYSLRFNIEPPIALSSEEIMTQHPELMSDELEKFSIHMSGLWEEVIQGLSGCSLACKTMVEFMLFELTHELPKFSLLVKPSVGYWAQVNPDPAQYYFESVKKAMQAGGRFWVNKGCPEYQVLETALRADQEEVCGIVSAILLESVCSYREGRSFRWHHE